MSAMPDKNTSDDEESGRILRFRQRRSDELQPPDLSKFEQNSEPDDYRHRMLMNAAGLVAVGASHRDRALARDLDRRAAQESGLRAVRPPQLCAD